MDRIVHSLVGIFVVLVAVAISDKIRNSHLRVIFTAVFDVLSRDGHFR